MDSGGLDPQIQISRPPDPEIWTLGTPEMTYFGPILDPFGAFWRSEWDHLQTRNPTNDARMLHYGVQIWGPEGAQNPQNQ